LPADTLSADPLIFRIHVNPSFGGVRDIKPFVALLIQQVLFGQQFYEKQKYSYFNQLVELYSKPV
jgi:hypothetical protein